MTGLDPNTSVPPDLLYEWRYEYYDDEEDPVSFEGLGAHRYSIVIGFWVGVAVFVLFMFFVLTLLTKTGAPHPESAEPCQKHVRLSGRVEDVVPPPAGPPIPDDDNNNRAGLSSRPSLASSRSLPHCYGDEEEEERRGVGLWGGGGASRGGRGLGGGAASPEEEEEEEEEGLVLASSPGQETVLLAHFDIPNSVNSEQGPMLGEDD